MYHLIIAVRYGDSFFDGVFKLLKEESFWQSYVASALITFPIVLLLMRIFQSNNGSRSEKSETQLPGLQTISQHELTQLNKRLLNIELMEKYRQGAEAGDAVAQFELGRCYAEGKGVQPDLKLSVIYLRKAAEQGHAEAQKHLARCYANGLGVKKDPEQAKVWTDKAAAQENSPTLTE